MQGKALSTNWKQLGLKRRRKKIKITILKYLKQLIIKEISNTLPFKQTIMHHVQVSVA